MFDTSDGVRLSVHDTGGPGPTVLLVHGWTSDSRVWDRVVPALAGIRVIRFDQRGHGESTAGPATITRLGEDLAELITALVPDGPLVLVGHSMGGMAMMALAESHPNLVAQRVSAAVFVSTSAGHMGTVTFGLPKPLVKRFLADKPTRTSPAAPRKRKPLPTFATLIALRWLAFGKTYRWPDVRSVADQAAAGHARTIAALRREIVTNHLRDKALAAYADIPTQVLCGTADKITPLAHAAAIAELLPGAEFVRYPRAGHMLPCEHPTDLAQRIRSLTTA
ncbi:alpha/beta hydrolase [Actinokineospora auranticolor]|uniref:Pimeloyl-ACP methyl ester carboxylesterase n=1 Tax=Actinokineospora auranticolor TaxID=155976 RepID=A0A2S6GDZ3_9PSEU|nr:alpha/beta hydrolase [Actinokineospora auranticolor]PPK63458.1 pimeloyl-ACP methyl ester carboxylesterase [Actinokineospora auranticolor]